MLVVRFGKRKRREHLFQDCNLWNGKIRELWEQVDSMAEAGQKGSRMGLAE